MTFGSCSRQETVPKEYSEFKGELFGKQVVISEKDSANINTVRVLGVNPNGEYTGAIVTNSLFFSGDDCITVGAWFFNAYAHAENPKDSLYKFLKNSLVVGQKAENIVGQRLSWNVYYKKANNIKLLEGENKNIEVVEVREVTTERNKIQQGYFPKTFWATYKIRGTFDELGKIDGVLKLKYLIY
ncbi:hypothetical protein GCM10011514_51420 [Emticicia aquatilis]|uniref:Uncharacterized protein n=1 Tax=Emticicia aquatilis TaxID=1537369 RepID=A0A917DZ93_9BACT|nr:hypothetical protein GCM10011514_51420 [Emticicia aquatilis]